jgi:hypothetical protein
MVCYRPVGLAVGVVERSSASKWWMLAGCGRVNLGRMRSDCPTARLCPDLHAQQPSTSIGTKARGGVSVARRVKCDGVGLSAEDAPM